MNGGDVLVPPQTGGPPGSRSRALGLLRKAPAETVTRVLQIVHDVVRTHAEVFREDQAFLHRMELLEATDATVTERLQFLRSILTEADLGEDAQLKIVEAICAVVVK